MRHVIDRPRQRSGRVLSKFAEIDLAVRAMPRRHIQILRRMPKSLDNDERLRRYLRIARRS